MKVTHQVTVLGREIPVRSSAPAAQVQAVESFVNKRLHDIGAALQSGDAQLVLILALLNTAEELLELRNSRKSDADLDERLRGILNRLESA